MRSAKTKIHRLNEKISISYFLELRRPQPTTSAQSDRGTKESGCGVHTGFPPMVGLV